MGTSTSGECPSDDGQVPRRRRLDLRHDAFCHAAEEFLVHVAAVGEGEQQMRKILTIFQIDSEKILRQQKGQYRWYAPFLSV